MPRIEGTSKEHHPENESTPIVPKSIPLKNDSLRIMSLTDDLTEQNKLSVKNTVRKTKYKDPPRELEFVEFPDIEEETSSEDSSIGEMTVDDKKEVGFKERCPIYILCSEEEISSTSFHFHFVRQPPLIQGYSQGGQLSMTFLMKKGETCDIADHTHAVDFERWECYPQDRFHATQARDSHKHDIYSLEDFAEDANIPIDRLLLFLN